MPQDFVKTSKSLFLRTISTFLCHKRQLQLPFRMLSGLRRDRVAGEDVAVFLQ